MTQFKSLPQVLDFFKSDEACKEYLVQQRWNGSPACPHCGNEKVYKTNRGYKCASKDCYKKFSVISGTIFENTKIELRTWFAAIYLCTAHKKGISSLQLSRDLGITQKTAWFVLHRVREMLREKAPQMLRNQVQVDETYVGGKNRNRHKNKRVEYAQGRSSQDKTPVVGLVEKDGKVLAFVVEKTDGDTLKGLMRKHVDKDAMVVTDSYSSYSGLTDEFKHITIKHVDGVYVVDNTYHTQNIENFWSLFKRGIIGIYHNISKKHLQRYCEEFSYRYNSRKITDGERFDVSVARVANARLTYSKLIEEVA